jgi:hypothetical protein
MSKPFWYDENKGELSRIVADNRERLTVLRELSKNATTRQRRVLRKISREHKDVLANVLAEAETERRQNAKR